MSCPADIIPWSRDMDKSTVVQMQCLCDVDILQSIDNVMDGKDYQQGSIEKAVSRQRNSLAI